MKNLFKCHKCGVEVGTDSNANRSCPKCNQPMDKILGPAKPELKPEPTPETKILRTPRGRSGKKK